MLNLAGNVGYMLLVYISIYIYLSIYIYIHTQQEVSYPNFSYPNIPVNLTPLETTLTKIQTGQKKKDNQNKAANIILEQTLPINHPRTTAAVFIPGVLGAQDYNFVSNEEP